MKLFIRQCILFALWSLPVILLYSAFKTGFHIPYTLDKSVDTIITGDSHVQCAIKDDLLSGIDNIALDSEGYIYSYYKLKSIISRNPHIKNIIIGFSFHNISFYYNGYIIGKDARKIMPRYIDLLSYKEIYNLVKTYPVLGIPALRKFFCLNGEKYPYIGEYNNGNTSKLSYDETIMKNRINAQYLLNNKPLGLSAINIEYMGRVVQLCKAYKINLIFIRTPLHNEYRSSIPEDHVAAYKRLVKEFNCPVIDFSGLTLEDSHFLPDGDHLNARGAIEATKYFSKIWKQF